MSNKYYLDNFWEQRLSTKTEVVNTDVKGIDLGMEGLPLFSFPFFLVISIIFV